MRLRVHMALIFWDLLLVYRRHPIHLVSYLLSYSLLLTLAPPRRLQQFPYLRPSFSFVPPSAPLLLRQPQQPSKAPTPPFPSLPPLLLLLHNHAEPPPTTTLPIVTPLRLQLLVLLHSRRQGPPLHSSTLTPLLLEFIRATEPRSSPTSSPNGSFELGSLTALLV